MTDECVVRMQHFLAEIAEFGGQAGAPLIELQFGDVATVTSLLLEAPGPSLSITAHLPRQEEFSFFDMSHCWIFFSDTALTACSELLWHADSGHYVVIRQIPVLDLPDERSVLDAIMDTSTDAASWLSRISGQAVAALIIES